jgi:hypothetical protein
MNPIIAVLVVCWLLSAVLAVANLALILFLKLRRETRRTHFAVFMVSPIWATLFFAMGFNQSMWLLVFGAFGIPLLVMGQFGHLVYLYRRLRPRRTQRTEDAEGDYNGLRCVSCRAPIDFGVRFCPKCSWTQPQCGGSTSGA